MTKKAAWMLLALAVLLVLAPAAFAQGANSPEASTTDWVTAALGLGFGIGILGCGIGQGRATASACEGMARNPGAGAGIRFSLILGLVFIESLSIYMLFLLIMQFFVYKRY